MLWNYVFTIIVICFLMAIWVAIQFAWRKTFPGVFEDEDVLAPTRRGGCQGCKCILICKKNLPFTNNKKEVGSKQ